MADEDDSQKTEDPTDKRKAKSRSDGEVAQSQEIKHWMSLLGGAFALLVLAPGVATDIRLISYKFIESPETISLDLEHLQFAFAEATLEIAIAVAPVLLLLMLLAFVANIIQTGFIWAPKKIVPEIKKISPLGGLKRMFSLYTTIEFIKGIMKLSLVTLVGLTVATPFLMDVGLFIGRSVGDMMDRLLIISVWFTLAAVGVMTAISALDYSYQKAKSIKQMKMTKQEIKDENKQSEGDPQVKARIRQIRSERAQQRMMASVPDADVIITNPTHYAIALEYKIKEMQAPILVAKGVDEVAARIRMCGEENDVPIVENPPLARALFASVEIDEEVPSEHYMAVAEVIGYVMRMRGELPPLQPDEESQVNNRD